MNVPLKNGVIKGDKRIRAVIPTIRKALDKNCAVIVLSHLGRPTEGVFEEEFSLAPVAERLGELLGKEVRFHAYDPELKVEAKNGEVVLLENVRFLTGEKEKQSGTRSEICVFRRYLCHGCFRCRPQSARFDRIRCPPSKNRCRRTAYAG